MSRHEAYGAARARDKPLHLTAHAVVGMEGERAQVRITDLVLVLEEPDHDNGKEARKWIGWRTVKVYYREEEERIYVQGVSATRRRFRV